MSTEDLKKEAAKKAITLIKDNTIVGLGAGSTIGHLFQFLKPQIENGIHIQLVTSSFSTRQLLLKNKFPVQPISSFKNIDIYFDGCDQLDHKLNALKSGGGIHTSEKLLSSMASQFVLIGDESKLVENFDNRFPVVIELLPQAVYYVPECIQNLFPHSKNAYRISEKKDGYVITENGNYLLDVWFGKWPDLSTMNPLLKSIAGVVESSLFFNLANKAIIAGKEGIRILERETR
ncbi:MAG: ribose 5-phosphate isomerase A [Bacteroidota bacterium]|nr:ribose 5-phosphate isomerase A [Bacteroidota bacterium]